MVEVKRALCKTCNQPVRVDEFQDNESLHEFSFSGMCQDCQDKTSGGDSPDTEESV